MTSRRGRATVAGLVTSLVAAFTVVVVGPSALAAPVSVAADAGTWQTDGRVNTVVYNADATIAYIGGIFHTLCPPDASSCTAATPNAYPVDYLTAIDVETGAPLRTWRPQPDGEVVTLARASNGTLYAGGYFNQMSGQVHRKLAAVNEGTGAAISSWRPTVNSQVKSVALSPQQDVVYFGGVFKTVNGVSRPLLAAVSAYSPTSSSATLLPWSPAPSGSDTYDKGSLMPPIVNSLVVGPDDGRVFVGGVFTSIGGLSRSDVAAVAPATGGGTGVADPAFDVQPSLHYVTLSLTLTRDGSTLFANGRGPGGFLRAYDSSSGTQLWARRFDGDVQAAVATDTVVYVGGHFDNVTIPGTKLTDLRHHLAAFDAATGETDPWNPVANSSYGVYALAWSPGHVIAGGDFTKINYLPHSGLAQFSGGDTAPPTAVNDLSATSTRKGVVDLSWSQVSDDDSPALTYRVYRRPVGGTFALIASITGPTGGGTPVTYADRGLAPGAQFEYRVRAADPVFLSAPGVIAGPVTVAGDAGAPSAPTDVTATATAPGVAMVTFTAASDTDDDTLTYTVVRNASGNSTTAGTVVGGTSGSLTFTDALPAGGTVTYTVRASDGSSTGPDSDPSPPVTIVRDAAAPTVPTSVQATSPSADTVRVTWTASTDADLPAGQLTYRVYRKASGTTGTGALVGTTAAGVTTYVEQASAPGGPAADKSYTYYVSAFDGALSSVKSSGSSTTVSSAIFSDSFADLGAWTLPSSASGASLDTGTGHVSAPSLSLTSSTSPATYGYAHRGLSGEYRSVCVQEWVALTAYGTTSNAQTTLLRTYSNAGDAIARLYVDNKGKLWIRSDWGSNPTITKIVVPADGSWHSAQLCVTTTPNGLDGTLSAWWDGSALGTITGVENGPDPLGSIDVGDTTPGAFAMRIDEVSVGTTKR